MSGWNYPDDSSRGPWDYGPGDYDQGPDYADYAESPVEQFYNEKRQMPRGTAPAWQGEDAPSDAGWGDIYTDEDTEPPWRDIPDPGFSEHEVDTHPDPDHMRDYRQSRFMRAKTYAASYQAKTKAKKEHYTEHYIADEVTEPPEPSGGRFFNRDPARGTTVPRFVGGDPADAISIEPPKGAGPTDARVMHDKDTGLGYDVVARPSPAHGPKAYDVLSSLE